MSKSTTLYQSKHQDIMFIPDMDFRDEYDELVEKLDLGSIKNDLWKKTFEVRDSVDILNDVDLSRLNIAFVHAHGNTGRGMGFCHYDPRADFGTLGVSLRVLDRFEGDISDFIAHELCHYKLYREGIIHKENDETFQGLLQEAGAATHYSWRFNKLTYRYE